MTSPPENPTKPDESIERARRRAAGGDLDATAVREEDATLARPSGEPGPGPSGPTAAGEDSRLAAGTLVADRYRIVTRLGKGGMGEVYRAEDLKLGQEVALKFLPPALEQDEECLALLFHEVKIARQITHPNVCRVYDLGEAEGVHFLSMEYIDGEDLSSLLRRIGRLPRDKAIELGRQVCEGLAAAHDAGILHRDLKPANLMIDGDGRARITDFGLAALSDTVRGDAIRSGTPAYMSPEQYYGREVTVRSDIFSLGLVLYQLFTGRKAYEASSMRELTELYKQGPPPDLSSLVAGFDPGLEKVILRCVSFDPEKRPASASEVATALAEGEGAAEGARIATLLLSDLVGSSALVERTGDAASAELFRQHDRLARDLLEKHEGREIDKTDGFLLLFDRPWQAVLYALDYHRALAELSRAEGVELESRVGIHLGEIVLRRNPPQDVARGAKPLEVEGLAKPTAARLMSVAGGRQTLMTHAAFDLARRGAIGSAQGAESLQWLAHGSYLFKGVEEPVEVFEVGVEGVAPLTAPESSEKVTRVADEETILGWRPAPSLEIPHRPNWVVVEKLGEGGFGEVWLGEHKKTGETRVFKFCYEAERLRSLQREITVFRLLKEELGLRDDIARILDWNLDEAPYFIEFVYIEGGSLVDWAAAQGGIAELPLEDRLELVAQVATALAAAHSVGVLHKDVKPGNVLIETRAERRPSAVLTDFGIGLVTDHELLASKGITVLGLTEMDVDGGSSATGTQLYMAPELLAGQPSTIQADIFALGVVLYQMVVGDLKRPLAHGWKRDVDDELLREDIAALIDGSPARRLGNAAELAERLRTLEERRAAREADQRAKREAEEARLLAERGRRRRKILAGAVAVLAVFGVAMTFQVRRANMEAARANLEAATSQDVSDFLLGLFQNPDPYRAVEKDLTLRDVLDAGATRIETELQEQPVLQARMMNTMGEVHRNLGLYEKSELLYEGALERRRRVRGNDHEETAESLHGVGTVLYRKAEYERAAEFFREALTIRRDRLGGDHQDVATTLYWLGDTLVELDKLDEAEQLFRESIAIHEKHQGGVHDDLAEAYNSLAVALDLKGDDTAVDYYQKSFDMYSELHGEDYILVARVLNNLGYFWKKRDEPKKAEPLFRRSLEIRRKVLKEPLHPQIGISVNNLASILNANQKYEEAEPLAREAVDILTRKHGADFWRTAVARSVLGASLAGQRRFEEAEPLLLETYPIIAERKKGMFYPVEALERLVSLYEAWGKEAEASRYRALLADARP